MPIKTRFEEKSVELYRSPLETIALILVAEALLGAGIYFSATNIEGNGRYVFVVVFGFFFLVLLSGLLPAINRFRCSNRELAGGASKLGFIVPATTTGLAEIRPPIVYEWTQIRKVIFVDRVIERMDGTTISFNRLLVLFDDLKLPENLLFGYVKLQLKLEDGGYYQLFSVPKARKADIAHKLRELAPDTVPIDELKRYEIS